MIDDHKFLSFVSFFAKHVVFQDHIFVPHRFSKDHAPVDPKRIDWPIFMEAINSPQDESSKYSHVKFYFIGFNTIMLYFYY